MLDFNPHKTNCTSCAACYSICPVHCISMEKDAEGFFYPYASDTCIHCGLCEEICPAVHHTHQEESFVQQCFAATHKDSNIWQRSTSGGAFASICEAWSDQDTMIVGAAWDGLRVHHIAVIGASNILPLHKSKYIASDIEDTFIQIREYLEQGKKVIFSGTPCQVAGLHAFLQNKWPNLLTVDFICHGTGSPDVFNECVKQISKQFGKEVTHYEFRAKPSQIHEGDYISEIQSGNSKLYITNDPYIQLFLKQDCLRPSCGANCMYRVKKRPSDITIADFKGLHQIFPELVGNKHNYSTIVFNTPKGTSILPKLQQNMHMLPCYIDDIIRFNPLFGQQTKASEHRDSFFAEFTKHPAKAIEMFTTPYLPFKRRLRTRMYYLLPAWLQKRLYNFACLIKKATNKNQ